ncbi:sulfotransferase family 2 domain-containing protein [Azorhizobium doebereinerae]|uniref:sulfotransferase family 2 domain-containing protein n=1 Tax=Azorhizobium doebereinerae TaxID=281091 RepID=UPI0004048AB8|nr:sulfotransferase family 2 domain-containing protein [Azorhizobium doebereinerae]
MKNRRPHRRPRLVDALNPFPEAEGHAGVAPAGGQPDPIRAGLPRIVFLHVPKTAGTTIDQIMRSYYPADDVCPERLDGIRFWPPEQLGRFRFFSMHDSYQNLSRIPPPWRMMTVLREPIDRLLSHYLYWRSYSNAVIDRQNIHILRLAKLHDLKSFLKLPVPALFNEIDNLTTRFLSDKVFNSRGELWRDEHEMLEAALENLDRIDFCGIYEHLPESIDLACRLFDVAPPREIAWTNNTRENFTLDPQSFVPVEAVEIDDETEELLVLRTRLDTIVYEAARARFLAQVGPRPRVFDRLHHAAGRKVVHYARTSVHGEPGTPGFLMFGPYARLRAGRYRAQFQIGMAAMDGAPAPDTPVARIDVCAEGGARLLAERVLTFGDMAQGDYERIDLPFVLPRTATDLEFRVFHTGLGPLAVESKVRLEQET